MKATETIIDAIDTLCDDVLSRFPRIISRLKGDDGAGGVEGVPCGIEGWGGNE